MLEIKRVLVVGGRGRVGMIICPECGLENEDTATNCASCGSLLTEEDEETRSDIFVPSFKKGATVAERYEILAEVGKGGFGRVFRARDVEAQEPVALKVLNPALTSDERVRARFLGEVKLCRRIAHPNVIKVFDVLELGGFCVIVMEYVDGRSLKQMIRQEGALGLGRAFTIVSQVCQGLDAAHSVGVVHRDVKPQNILITKSLGVKIVDFGLARHLGGKSISQSGVILGTPEYMSPEQVSGKSVDARSDIYSLGVVMYEMLTGRVPFPGETPVAIILGHLKKPPESPRTLRPDLPPWASYMVLKAMAKKPAHRFQKATEIAEYFERNLRDSQDGGTVQAASEESVPEQARVATAVHPPRRPAVRPQGAWRALVFLLAVFLVVVGYLVFIAVRTHLESSDYIQSVIRIAKQQEGNFDYRGAFRTYVKAARNVSFSPSLYARAVIAYIEYLSQAHPMPLMLSLLGLLVILFIPLLLIRRRLRR